MVISDSWSKKNRDKENSASRDRPIVRPVPVAAALEEHGQREKEKVLGRWVLSGSPRINVQMGFFWCPTDNHVRIVAVI